MSGRARARANRRERTRFAAGAILLAVLVASLGAASDSEPVRAMFRPILSAPEARARMTIERSDPFGGEPSRERGTLWLLPSRGLRYKSSEAGGQDLALDRGREQFLLYSPSERVVYRAAYARAPSRLRRLVADPDRFLSADLSATPERRRVRGAVVDGYRLRSASLGDSMRDVSVWVARDRASAFPRWISVASATDTILVEFREWTLLKTARIADLRLDVPSGTRELPLDPRELLERGGGGIESR